jgi:hypothetical protein
MAESMTQCLCGADDLVVGPSTKRSAARTAYETRAAELEQQGLTSGAAQREYNHIILALQVLSAEDYEVYCNNCGRWVHDNTEYLAVNLWNRALAKLDHLQPCCRESSEHRTDFDGMALCVCTSPDHDGTINGHRWLPLDPDEAYDVKPTDAGTRT